MPGTTIAHFRILERLEQHPTHETYSGKDLRSSGAVVIRVIRAEALANGHVRERILKAARVGCSLEHPNVCGPYYFEESAGAIVVITPRVDAGTLAQRLDDAPMNLAVALDIAIQIAEALSAVHAAGLVHGYLSPEQILLAPRPVGHPQVKLINVGLCVHANPYCAPECRAEQDLSPVSDTWSLGAVLSAMLGRLTNSGNTDVPAALGEVVAQALADDPAVRFQSAAEFAACLQPLLRAARESESTVLLDGGPAPPAEAATEGPDIPVRSFFRVDDEATQPEHSVDSRYVDIGLLGKGGMAEVRRVRDRALNRVLAMKIMRQGRDPLGARFVQEARITAQLQHPAIIPVHEIGTLADGRPYFTMKEVQGQTLTAAISEAHADWSVSGGTAAPQTKWTLRQLIGILQRASEGVGYAHDRGVLHRDIKPSNIMIGTFGEVLILDWGLTRVGDTPAHDSRGSSAQFETGPITDDSRGGDHTHFGAVMGTPGFMSPEQASGDLARLAAPTDVFSLGCALYNILSGSPPWNGPHMTGAKPHEIKTEIGPRAGERGPLIPAEIREICLRAMASDPLDRFRNASEFANALAAWLEGAQRRDQAMRVLDQARELKPQAQEVRHEAAKLERHAAEILAMVPPFAPVDAKRPAWSMQDRAAELRIQAEVSDARFTNTVNAALSLCDDLAPAHDMLAEHYRERHALAETARDEAAMIRYETLLRAHDTGRFAAYLKGDGALTLFTDPPGAKATLYRFEAVERRLAPHFTCELGCTPIEGRSIPMGSYVVKLSHPGRAAVDYPVLIERELHWDGIRPGDSTSHPIYLPGLHELGDDERYIPAGWFWSGGDPKARNSLPARRLWLDAFATPRFPVTIEDYLAMLNDLAAAGHDEEAAAALPLVPEWEDRARVEQREFGFSREASGRYIFEGGEERLRLPMVLISWRQARSYSEWLASHSGAPWRLIPEMEHEKANRGVDARYFPWGNYLDPTFCAMRDSHAGAGRALRCTVDEYPLDESPYGIRGFAGNTHSWCEDAYSPTGPEIVNGIPYPPDPATLKGPGAGGGHRLIRGGSYRDPETYCRTSFRDCPAAIFRSNNIGFRVSRPLL